jgi:hypothetical protein
MGNPLRWVDPETAAAWFDLRALAPQLSGLIYCAPMPDQALSVLLNWADAVAAPDGSDAFTLARLGTVLPALVTAFVAAHTYGQGDSGGDVVELFDAGCGAIVARVLPMAGLIAVALHGDAGRALVEASRADLARTLTRIHALMIGR